MGVAEDDNVIAAAEVFAQVARALLEERDLSDTLQRIVDLAVEHLEGCEYAGISYVERRGITSPASSNAIPRTVDRIQAELDEGPCLDAIREHEVFRTGDLTTESRWPQFSKRAHEETGVTSVLALRLFTEGDTMGALNLYSTAGDAFDDGAVALAAVFATHAAVAMRSAKREANLQHMADTRDLIGRAKGILMSLQHVTDERAFELLVEASQRLNVKLVTVAEEVNEIGQLPE